MISINSINHFPMTSLRLQKKPVRMESITTRNEIIKSVKQIVRNSLNTAVMNQLPQGLVNEMTDIVRHIGASVLQSSELDQTFKNRDALQSGITEDISSLKTALSEFSQDDLKLFAALFQNQIVTGSGNSDINQNSFNSNPFLNGEAGNFFDDLFRFNVTSQSGSLVALDLTGTIMNILSSRNSAPGLLESLLNSLNDLSVNFQDNNNST